MERYSCWFPSFKARRETPCGLKTRNAHGTLFAGALSIPSVQLKNTLNSKMRKLQYL